jgi:hypothetical protein
MTEASPEKVILLFPSIHYVLKAEKTLKAAGLPFDLIPVPREINSDCGMAVEVGRQVLHATEMALNNAKIKPDALFIYRERSYHPYKAV